MTTQIATSGDTRKARIFFILPGHASWWVWLITACLLAVGLVGYPLGFQAAILLSVLQTLVFLLREQSVSAFPVQLRIAYTLLLLVCTIPGMQWLYWLPTVGTFALNIFGYCLMARCLSLLPWNLREPVTLDLLIRTFVSRPILAEPSGDATDSGCAGGVCSIEAQVRRRRPFPSESSS